MITALLVHAAISLSAPVVMHGLVISAPVDYFIISRILEEDYD